MTAWHLVRWLKGRPDDPKRPRMKLARDELGLNGAVSVPMDIYRFEPWRHCFQGHRFYPGKRVRASEILYSWDHEPTHAELVAAKAAILRR